MNPEAIILAGGLGTRLKSVLPDTPKPMALIRGKPFLAYLLDQLREWGIQRVILSIGYRYLDIQSFFSTEYYDIELIYSIENEPLGTGGGIRKALDHAAGNDVLVLNGDSMYRIGLQPFVEFHLTRQAALSIALRNQPETRRYGRVELNDRQQVTGFIEKSQHASGGWINGGIYLINTAFFRQYSPADRFSLETDFLPRCLKTRQLYGYPAKGYFLDIGTPESLKRAQHEFKRFEH
ncbi:MAG: nucleotidyltransferase family protein [Bacteroidales bacterium]|nr:nucleotidyltransferase family protein [Bacteroidales bacterium]